MADASEQSNHALTTLSTLEQYYIEGKYWDVQIWVNTKVFKCHRWLLAVHSEYFDTMFSSNNFVESNTSKDKPIALAEMDESAFEQLLHFMYTGAICVKDSNVLPFLFMNDYLRLRYSRVKEQCLEYVKDRSQKNKPMSNVLDLLRFTHLKGEKVFIDILNAHICRHLCHYSMDERLVEIPFEILNAVLETSKGYILPLRGSSDILLQIVYNWINHNREGRSQYHKNLMENIDLENISSNFSRALINRLENAVNEVVNLSEDLESLSKLKMLVMGVATDLPVSDDQFNAIISFNFKNVSEMQIHNPKQYSSSCIIFDLSWKIGIKRKGDALAMYLFCNGVNVSSEWNCYASAKFTIVSHKEGRGDFVGNMRRALFSSTKKSSGWGSRSRMKWNDLIDSANGYLYDDGSITLNVHVFADVPFLKMI